MRRPLIPAALAAALALSGCATSPSPVEVTRFHDPARLAPIGQGTVTVEAGMVAEDSLALRPYEMAVAEELRSLGYTMGREGASDYIASVNVDRYVIGAEGRRSPVSVGVGGSTGSYGSGVGIGLGINLGGSGERLGSELRVIMRDRATGQSVWEGRAEVDYPPRSDLADRRTNAQALAQALFRDFPGNNGETVRIELTD